MLDKIKNFFKNKDICKVIILIALIILLLFLAFNIYVRYSSKLNFEDETLKISEINQKKIFSINKIYSFSSANASNSEDNKSASWTLNNLYQYTDIAFFIDNNKEELGLTYENTIKELYINNIKIDNYPSIGTPILYYKNVNDFGKNSYTEEMKLTDNIDFDIVSKNIDYTKPQLYNNCSNPITIGYINQNIQESFTITDTKTPLVFNGSLLKRANIPLTSLESTISFKINIINNLDQHFECNFIYKIPLKDNTSESSIYDGSFTLNQENLTNYTFYRTK